MEPSNGGKIPANCEKRQGEPYDVRRLHTARKQSAIMSMFDGLDPGQIFSVILAYKQLSGKPVLPSA
ncbi:hypothetical protein MPL1032_160191 [Mesorhizobium plurifarium]|uniref:Uncharacterized protein n=1 Tax=Mesorhizobium plurifarium TaxID=69974 RepID=A0A0K2VTQ5_MESPL|nr:hypothetical protein MPL1032_160191 [Mesorhizobium plurifarium]